MIPNPSTTWRPRHTLAHYAFATEQEHERAFAWAAAVGVQPALSAADVLPPLAHTLDLLVAYAALRARGDGWTDIPLATFDPRAPQYADTMPLGRAYALGHGSWLLLRPCRLGTADNGEECCVFRLMAAADAGVSRVSRVTEHILFEEDAQVPVRFRSYPIAERRLRSVVMAGGQLPREWCWKPSPVEPPADEPGGVWVPVSFNPHNPYVAGIVRGDWRIQTFAYRYDGQYDVARNVGAGFDMWGGRGYIEHAGTSQEVLHHLTGGEAACWKAF